MYTVAYAVLLLTLLIAVGGAGIGIAQAWSQKTTDAKWIERANLGVGLGLIFASLVFLLALIRLDFQVENVYRYTDSMLPLFYRLTAFWAGQAGSMLFWALMVAIMGLLFQYSKAYRSLSDSTKNWFWIFYLTIMAFFSLLLTTWNNPFTLLPQIPAEGGGLNPMLQNPGMIFHPPLLFLGYGGFVIPGCLGLAQAMTRRSNGGENPGEQNWPIIARPFTLTAWLFLTAGIVLGAWWAYMELGWGGYWAWDPVENASMLPWLLGTAALHASLLETRRGKMQRSNIFLMAMTTLAAFFATYLVRGNVVDSVHAYAGHGVGLPLLAFVLFFLAAIIWVSWQGGRAEPKGLESIETREGFALITIWMFIAISLLILIATLWPVISALWSSRPMGLTAGFYNRVCLPLFVLITALLAFCPWLGWKGGVRSLSKIFVVALGFVLGMATAWFTGLRDPLAMLALAAAGGALVSLILLLAQTSVRAHLPTLAAHLVHLGLVLLVLGIAFSGPGKLEVTAAVAPGETIRVRNFEAQLAELIPWQQSPSGEFRYMQATINLSRNGRDLGQVSPQLRVYASFPQNEFAEAGARFSLIDEFYATLLSTDSMGRAVLRVSSNPGVNWIWIGGVIMTLAPFLSLGRKRAQVQRED